METIFTESDTLDELREMVRDAVAVHFDDGRAHAVRLTPETNTL
jgi:hypothetical protein